MLVSKKMPKFDIIYFLNEFSSSVTTHILFAILKSTFLSNPGGQDRKRSIVQSSKFTVVSTKVEGLSLRVHCQIVFLQFFCDSHDSQTRPILAVRLVVEFGHLCFSFRSFCFISGSDWTRPNGYTEYSHGDK